MLKKLLLVLVCLSFLTVTVSAVDISTCQELFEIDFDPSCNVAGNYNNIDYDLVNDIDCSGHGWNNTLFSTNQNGNDWCGKYNGTFDGNGYTVSNININNSDANNPKQLSQTGIGGLFGKVSGNVQNLNLVNVTVLGGTNSRPSSCGFGNVDGYVDSVTIDGCNLPEAKSNSAGFVTECYDDGDAQVPITIRNSWVKDLELNVTQAGADHIGGFVGGGSCFIENSFVEGEIYFDSIASGTENGGFVGGWWYDGSPSSLATILNSYTRVNMNAGADDTASGFAGGQGGFVNNSYSANVLTGADSYAFVVYTDDGGAGAGLCPESYYDNDTHGQVEDVACGTAKTTAEMKTLSTFSAWDSAVCENVLWLVEPDYPCLLNVGDDCSCSRAVPLGEYTLNVGNVVGADNSTLLGVNVSVSADSTVPETLSQAGEVAQDTTTALAGVTTWFPIVVVLAVMVVLILLVVVIINSIKGTGLMEGSA